MFAQGHRDNEETPVKTPHFIYVTLGAFVATSIFVMGLNLGSIRADINKLAENGIVFSLDKSDGR